MLRMAPFAEWRATDGGLVLVEGDSFAFGASGMFHRPFVSLRLPTMMTFPFL
jgi:hypothetical protein